MRKVDRELYELHARLCKVFTSPKRLEVLDALREGELSVGELADRLNISQANLSQHLSILRDKGVVKTRREGTTIFYSLTTGKIVQAFDLIHEVLMERITETEKLSQTLREG
ncbi:MAG: metalloregulator ArsR/SmtB family transcription factor [Bacillota bacterium]